MFGRFFKRAALVLLAAGVAAVIASCSSDSDELGVTQTGFVVEPAENPGPDAFTPPVSTDDDQICDKEKLIRELESRPEAFRAWAAVLEIPEEAVPDYIRSLEPQVLDSDTSVTNHGLHDGVAYARPAVLKAETAVLTDTNFTSNGTQVVVPSPTPSPQDSPSASPSPSPSPDDSPSPSPPDGTPTPGPSPDGKDTPVTRCKCGNPLLPPYAPAVPRDGDEPEPTPTPTPSPSPPGARRVPEPTPSPSPPGARRVPEPTDEPSPQPSDEPTNGPVQPVPPNGPDPNRPDEE